MNDKDKLYRIKYLQGEKEKQECRKDFYLKQIRKLNTTLQVSEKEILENKGWIKFHKNCIMKHKKEISTSLDNNYKKNQEEKLKFHMDQVNKHHEKNIEYHNREIAAAIEEMKLFQKGAIRCEKQLLTITNRLITSASSTIPSTEQHPHSYS